MNFRELSGRLTSRAFLFPAKPGVFRLNRKREKYTWKILNRICGAKFTWLVHPVLSYCFSEGYCNHQCYIPQKFYKASKNVFVPSLLNHAINLPHIDSKTWPGWFETKRKFFFCSLQITAPTPSVQSLGKHVSRLMKVFKISFNTNSQCRKAVVVEHMPYPFHLNWSLSSFSITCFQVSILSFFQCTRGSKSRCTNDCHSSILYRFIKTIRGEDLKGWQQKLWRTTKTEK